MAKERKFHFTIAAPSINNFQYYCVLVTIFPDIQWPYSLTSQYFKDVVRKLLFDDYSKSFNYWGDAERMYEECCIGFRSNDLFFPEKI